MTRVIFIQPVLAKYRVDFFEELNKSYPTHVHYSKFDFLGVKSVEDTNIRFAKKLIGNFISFAGRLYWQKGVNLYSYHQDDIVVISGNPRVVNHMLLLLICKLRNIPVIWWGQGWTAGSHGLMSKLRLKLMSIADGVAVYTENEACKLDHLNRVVGLNNGLDIDFIRTISKSIKINQENKQCPETLNILYIGRLTEKSNINLLIASLTLINRDFHLHIIGDGQLKPSIENFIKNNKLDSKVTLHGALYNESQIAEIANNCDCFVYPGAVGLSLIHAFAYGLPAIIHNYSHDHMPEFSAFVEGWNGISFTQNDKYSLAKAIDSIDEKSLITMKKNAYDTVSFTYNTKDMAVRFSKLIRSLQK